MKSSLEPLMASNNLNWETPPELFGVLNREFGFTLDAAANAHNTKCRHYISVKEDALTCSWGMNERIWLNPPYGRKLSEWVIKARRESFNNNIVVMLIPARTDTSYWHHYVAEAAEIRFLKGRLKFVGAEASAPFPSAIVVFNQVAISSPRRPRIKFWDWKGEGIE